MQVYTYITLSRRTQITLKDRQHRLLLEESARSGLPMAELVRRALDSVYRPASRPKIAGFSVSAGMWRDADAAIVGRRVLVRKPRLSDDVY
jgi:hypothetical protein